MRLHLSKFAAVLLLLQVALQTGCASSQPFIAPWARTWALETPPPDSLRAFQVYLIGDVGEPSPEAGGRVLTFLSSKLDSAGPSSAVVFLGDNIYPCGLLHEDDPSRPQGEASLLLILDSVRGFQGKIVFIPGNHDWDFRRVGSAEAVWRQEDFIEAHLGQGNTFMPDRGFPGPAEVALTDDLTLIALDTQWWLHKEDRPYGDTGSYLLETQDDFLREVDLAIQRHADQHVLVVGHHPMYSNGTHAGHHPLKHHLFPLTIKVKWAYVPLPVIGSLYVAYTRYVGGTQELAGKRYKALRTHLLQSFNEHERLIYASGHDHSLAYFLRGEHHYLVSGSGSRVDHVASGHGATFAAAEPGFMQLDYYRDGQVWLTVWSPVGDGHEGVMLFRHRLENGQALIPDVQATSSHR